VSVEQELNDEFDEGLEEEDFDDDGDDVGAEGNRVVGARAQAVTEYLARELAEDADAIDVTVTESRGEITLLIHASPSDLGRLIGRRGRVIQAVRQVARAAGALDRVRVSVEVAE
jgi:predicted RNA-binding protein YlqC (UPF0109 family)